MTKNISREALYELVWSKPMTHVAKDLGISDVMLGKMCKEQLVPKPPRGYWANLGSDKKRVVYVRPELPDLFQKKNDFNQWVLDDYKLRESLRADKFEPEDLNDPVREPPPHLGRPFHGQHPAQVRHGCLGSAVSNTSASGNGAHHTGDVDDAAAVLAQCRPESLAAAEHAREVDVHHARPFLLGVVLELAPDLEAVAVDQAIDRSALALDFGPRRIQRLALGHVGLHEAGSRHLLRGLRQVQHEHPCAQGHQVAGDGRPDGARAAGDRNAPAGEHAARLDARVLVLVRVLHLLVLTWRGTAALRRSCGSNRFAERQISLCRRGLLRMGWPWRPPPAPGRSRAQRHRGRWIRHPHG